MKPEFFFAETSTVIVEYDPERADYSNPRGEIYGSAGYVYAEDSKGNRLRQRVSTHYSDSVALSAAQRVANALNRRLATGKLPVGFTRWDVARPAYGSDAYVEYGAADDLEWERSLEEEI